MNYQERYLAHQKRKKDSLSGRYEPEIKYTDDVKAKVETVFKQRKSGRVFSGEPVKEEELNYILELVGTSPSSCDRQGVGYQIITERTEKELLGGLLVGGAGWIHRADKIILLSADMEAYVSPAERDFMPYLDAGTMIQSFYLASEVQGVKCCFVNPNIREENKEIFKQRFSDKLFCGAIALGK